MDANNAADMAHHKGHLGMNTPPIVSPEAWEAARQQMLVKEKAVPAPVTRWPPSRRRMPWMAVEKAYDFVGPQGKVSVLDPVRKAAVS